MYFNVDLTKQLILNLDLTSDMLIRMLVEVILFLRNVIKLLADVRATFLCLGFASISDQTGNTSDRSTDFYNKLSCTLRPVI